MYRNPVSHVYDILLPLQLTLPEIFKDNVTTLNCAYKPGLIQLRKGFYGFINEGSYLLGGL